MEGFMEASKVLLDNHLVILKNFLLYDPPDNPNQLVGWIECCEELPKSNQFKALKDHLEQEIDRKPDWLFSGLIDPIADGKRRNLKALFWERTNRNKPSPKGIKEPSPKEDERALPNQEQEQEQEQDKSSLSPTSLSSSTLLSEMREDTSKDQYKDPLLGVQQHAQLWVDYAIGEATNPGTSQILREKCLMELRRFMGDCPDDDFFRKCIEQGMSGNGSKKIKKSYPYLCTVAESVKATPKSTDFRSPPVAQAPPKEVKTIDDVYRALEGDGLPNIVLTKIRNYPPDNEALITLRELPILKLCSDQLLISWLRHFNG
ncbi:MAG TPA: hypothetical protein VJL87_03470 [Bdellovibrionota bacterium]|nr:hypothetical protein [Bdellovibrionota bacterium]